MKVLTNSRFFVLVSIVSALVLFDEASFASTSAERDTLRGIAAVRVLVKASFADEGARSLGITEEQLLADAEQTLRRAGIKVASNVQPYLLLSVSILSISHPRAEGTLAYVYTAQLKLRQGALIDSNATRASVTTWDETRFGASTPTQRLKELIRQSVNALVGDFIRDYRAANPAQVIP